MVIKLTVLGNLPRKSNSRRLVTNRHTGKPLFIKSQKALQYEEDFNKQVPNKYKQNLDMPLSLDATIFYQSNRSDLSDELLCDCLEKSGVIKNDRLIVEKRLCKKIDKINPRVEFELSEFKIGGTD